MKKYKLIFLENTGKKKYNLKTAMYKCWCDNIIEIPIRFVDKGIRISCGCARGNPTHGKTQSRIYRIWSGMKQRCTQETNPKFSYYGGRGIKLCRRWHNFELFFEDMGGSYKDGLSIERKNNNIGYTPRNCIWGTPTQQNRNKRSAVRYKGEHATDAAKRLGITQSAVNRRFALGWSIHDVFTIEKKRDKRYIYGKK